MIKKYLTVIFISLFMGASAYAEDRGRFAASGAFHFKNHSFLAQGRYVKKISPKTLIAPALAFDFDLEEFVLDVDLHIINPGTRYYGIGGFNYGDSEAGMNFGMGMNFNYNEKHQGFGEIKYIFIGWSGVVLNVGLYF